VLSLIDFSNAFDLLKIPLPTNQKRILNRLVEEALLVSKPGGVFEITNLGALLFAKDFMASRCQPLFLVLVRGDCGGVFVRFALA
jgi:hypothetical protein